MSNPDISEPTRTFVRVYRLPDKMTNGYCFGTGVPIPFLNVDWFETPIDEGKGPLIDFIKNKRYYTSNAQFLVIGDHPDFVFRIDRAVQQTGAA